MSSWSEAKGQVNDRRVRKIEEKARRRARGAEYLYTEAVGQDKQRLLNAGWEPVQSTPRAIGPALVERLLLRKPNTAA